MVCGQGHEIIVCAEDNLRNNIYLRAMNTQIAFILYKLLIGIITLKRKVESLGLGFQLE